MAYTRTLAELRTSLTIRGGFENSADLTSTVLNELLNESIEEAWDVIVQRWEDYYTTSTAIAVISGTDTYSVPTDFLKLRRLWILDSGTEYKRLFPGDIDIAHIYTSSSLASKNYRYRMMGRSIVLMPVPPQNETLKLFYIPTATQLASDSDSITFDVPLECKLVLAIAWRECLDRQELDTAAAAAKVAEFTAKLRASADGRDADQPFYLDGSHPPGSDWWDDEVYR